MGGYYRLPALPLKVAQESRLCRLCHRRDQDPSPFDPAAHDSMKPHRAFRLDFGREFAHEACLDKWPSRAWLARKRHAKLSAFRKVVADRAGKLWRDPIQVRALHARDERARRLIERCEQVLDTYIPSDVRGD